MRKISLVFIFMLLLACNISRAAPTPVQTGSQAGQTPSALATQPAEATAPPAPPTAPASATPLAVVEVPFSPVLIEGLMYLAYQIPGDPFRFVCQEPCTLDLQYIYAEYAGFRVARAELIKLTGIDTLAELQPVDMHLDLQDSICKDAPYGHAYVYAKAHQAFTCSEGPGHYPALEEKIRMAARPEEQYFPLHEYMHTFFFGRLSGKAGSFEDVKATFMHDFVVTIPSYALGIMDPAGFCSYDGPTPGDYNGRLTNELCSQNGFQLKDLAPSLVELDTLYASGAGQVAQAGYEHPAATIAQYRDILNRLLGSDTTKAFAAACWPPALFGNSYNLSGVCAPPTSSATATVVK
jgi:hypothetical protein